MVKAAKLVTLEEVQPSSEDRILPDFPARVDGKRVWVTAVLDRTAVVEPAPGEPKILVNRRRCLVDPRQIRFGPIAARHAARRGRDAARQVRRRRQESTAA